MCDFKPGEEVICVDSSGAEPGLINGAHYVVKTAWHDEIGINVKTGLIGIGCFLAVGSPCELPEGGWYARRFRRPIVEEHGIKLEVVEVHMGPLVMT